VYATYLGGNDSDQVNGIAVDPSGDAYVAGVTNSVGFPTTLGALQTTDGGSSDAFVAKLNVTGTSLLYATYLGGSGDDAANGIAVDRSGNAYVTGVTNSIRFPTTSGAFQPKYGGGLYDAFVTELNSVGTALLYSTYLSGSGGPSGGDYGAGIAVDSLGNAFITGFTYSSDFPTTPGAVQPTYGGNVDAFLAKLNATGSRLLYATYFGCNGYDRAYGVAVDGSGNAYVTGNTTSSNFPTTPGALQSTITGPNNAFVAKILFAQPPTVACSVPSPCSGRRITS
jgi:hypothetical protein